MSSPTYAAPNLLAPPQADGTRLSICNENPKILPGLGLLHELISWQSSNAPALEFLGPEGDHPFSEKLWKASYSELQRCVNSLAKELHSVLSSSAAGEGEYLDGKQPIIPVLLPQSPGLYISQLATLQIGAAFCPINGDAPTERVKFICGDVGARVVIAMRSDEGRVTWAQEENITVVWVEDYFSIPEPSEEEPVIDDGAAVAKKLRVAKTTDLAYIMYTSGSTGLPKGVGVSHLAVTQSLFAHDLFLPEFGRLLQFAAPSFDVSVFEIFFPLFKGKTLVGCSRQRLLNDLPGMINCLEVDGCELTPTVVNSLLGKRSAVPNLRLLLTIGEMLTRPVVDEFGYDDERPGLLYGMYGPTEAAIHCTANCLMAAGSKVGNIGMPFETVSCFIAAIPEEGQTSTEIKVLPLGEVGELILGGPQLADGYLNREKENKAAFMTYNGERAYRTGDKGRMLEDGTIEVMGRISAGQVKLRGQRVELGEIEEVVYKQKGIKMAFASVLQGMLIVFASTKGEEVKLEDLNATCEKWLPRYMVPSELVVMQEFPYLPSGKINKKQLEADYLARRTEEDGKEEEMNDTERTISEVVKDLLGLKVKIDKRLASYGLDSLMAIRLASQLKVHGLKITPVEILRAEAVSAIAAVCDANTSVLSLPAEVEEFDFSSLDEPVWNYLEEQGIVEITEEIFPCTPLQDAMLMETAVDSKTYQNFVQLRLQGSFSEDTLRTTIEKWADQNPILRTGFADVKSEWSAYTQFVLQMLPEERVIMGTGSGRSGTLSEVSVLRPLLINIRQGVEVTELDIYIHHALYDGWSLELLIEDLNTVLINPDAKFVERPPFRTVVEQQLRLKEQDLSKETQYWTDHLSSLAPSSLPNFNSTTSVTPRLARTSLSTSISTKKLEEVARTLEVSSQSLIQAAYSLLLSFYLGKSDICFGTVFSGRTGGVDGVEEISGPTLSTLPIRIDTASTSTLASLAQSLNSVVRKHLENDVLPLREIKKLADQETQGRSLFDTLVIWQQTLKTEEKKGVVELVKSEDQLELALTLEITPKKEGLKFDVTYQTAVLPEQQVVLLMTQIEAMVVAILENADVEVAKAAGRLDSSLLSIANATPSIPDTPVSLAASVELMAANHPDQTAVEFVIINSSGRYETETASYKELNERANQIAHFLHSQGVQPDQLVAICMEKSIALYVSILAVIKAGAGYLPVTPDTPVERIQTIIKDASVKICLTAASTTAYLEDKTEAKILDVDTVDATSLSTSDPSVVSTPENLAYAVFTSGSTGVPKGVLVNAASVLANLETLKSVYPHCPETRLLQSCSQGFDVSVFEIFWTWTIGGTLVSGTKNTVFSDIEKLINDRAITHLSLTATVAALVNPVNVPSVEVLISAGEAMTGKVFSSWAGVEGKKLFNAYGPSETTNVVTATSPIQSADVLASIGKPLDTVSCFVLASKEDKDPSDFTLLPLGAEGELCYGGPQVARGYLDTSQNVGKFITDPVYGRIYRTGDYGRLLPDGQIIYTGRKDDQVKIRGQRVELGEISKTLLASEVVDDCMTLIIEGEKEEDRRLVTFFTLKEQSKTNEFRVLEAEKKVQEALWEKLVGGLPIYMVPSALIPVSTLPSTLVGKVDKKLLKSAFAALSQEQINASSNSQEGAGVDYEFTELEQQVASAVAQVAEVDEKAVGPNTSFFALGIDSISAISLVRLLRDAGLRVEISDVLKHASTARLAKVVGSQQARPKNLLERHAMLPTPEESTFDPEFLEETIDTLARQGNKVERFLPCTPLQEAMLFASELSSEGGAYKNQVTLDLRVSVEKMEEAWKEMVKRHEILRTVFVKSGHAKFAYSQVVLAEYEHNSRTLEAPSVAAAISMAEAADADKDDALEPPYSLIYVQQPSDGKTKLVLSMHHALYDGFAMSVLYKEIETYLFDQQLGAPVSFAPFLRYMSGVDESKSDAYWSGLLKNFSPVAFTTPKEIEKQNHILTSPLTVSLSAMETQLKQHSTTLLYACQAAWIATLAHTTKTVDLVFGNVVSGRTVPVPGLNELVAPCFNTIPFRLNNIHKLSFLEAFRRLQAQNIDALPYQLTALRKIQGLANTEGKSLFDSLLLLQTPSTPLYEKIWAVEEDEGSMDLPVVVEVVPQPDNDKLSVTLHVNDLSLSADAVQQVMNTFQSFLTSALENPRQQIIADSKDKQAFAANTVALKNKKTSTNSEGAADSAWTETEEKVRDVIAKFTTVPKDGIKKSTSIYRLGLDSINAVQVATLLRKEGWAVAASDVLQHPSIEALAEHIDSFSSMQDKTEVAKFDFASFEAKHHTAILAKIGKTAEDIMEINPCTAVQSGMLAQTLHSGGKEYVNSFGMELASGTDIETLKAAWWSVASACDMLRTVFVDVEDQQYPFVMVTHRDLQLPWKEVNSEAQLADVVMDHKKLEEEPWMLEHFKRNDKDVVRFTAHHALYDAASLQLFLVDVQAAYVGEEIKPYTPIRSVLGTLLPANQGKEEEAKKFWTKKMTVHPHRFPDLTPIRATSTKSLAKTGVSKLPLEEIEELAKEKGVSVQAAGQAAWGRLLSMYTGEPSVTFGVTLSGKSILDSVDIERVALPTIVTLPVSCDVVGSNSELLGKSMEGNAGLSKWQFTPLTSIARWNQVEGAMFDTLFAYQKTAGEFESEETGTLWKVTDEVASADYVVSIEMLPTRDGKLELCVTAKENVVPREQVELILKQFDALLLDTLKNGDAKADGLIVEEEKEAILSTTPPAQRTMGSEHMLLHDFVSRSAQMYPNKTALEFTTCLEPLDSKTWSFREMEGEANKIAHLLQKLNVPQGELVAICFDKCPEASWSIIGILKAGCAYVALDPGAPGDRVKFIMEDSKATVVLSSGKPALNFTDIFKDESTVCVINLDDCPELADCSTEAPKLERAIDPGDTSYCLYTSGTTGTPKGCELTHENAVQAMHAFTHLFGDKTTENSKWLQFASFHFDVSVLEQFFAWMHGFCLTSAPRDLVFEDIALAINKLGVTHLDLTPSLARLLTPEMVPGLAKGMFITGGEALRQDILDMWGECGAVYNGYGPTEATIGCTMFPRCPANGKPANIGPQFQNVGSFVVKKETDEPVLRGAVGELVVSGKLVGKGYLNRPELTAERFPTMHGERVYRTGDLVRITHDGTFLFLGRADDQVKLRGQRLELSEITEVIKKGVDGVDECVALVLKHEKQMKEQLVAFFVPTVEGAKEPINLVGPARQACVERLPGYMVPTHFVPLEKLPLSANNKADGKQLAAIYNKLSIDELQKLSSAGQSAREWSGEEKEVVNILAQAMNLPAEDLKMGTNIFELGYDSISVIGLSQKLQAAGFDVKLATVMKNSAIEALVKVLLADGEGASNGGKSAGGDVVAAQQKIKAFAHRHLPAVAEELDVDASEIESIAPCTAAQEGMVFRFLDSEEALYFSTFEFALGGDLDMEKLKNAWGAATSKLEVLRMKFVLTDAGIAQVVLKEVELPWIQDMKTKEYRDTEKNDALANPWKIAIHSADDGKKTMKLHIFHGLYDGVALPLLMEHVADAYKGVDNIDSAPSFLSCLAHGPLATGEGAKEFWMKALDNAQHTPLPELASFANTEDVVLSKTLNGLEHLEALRQKLGVTYQAIIQAAWTVTLQNYLKSSSAPTFGVVVSGRSIDYLNAKKIVGPLLNTLVFHASTEQGMSWEVLIKKCHEYNTSVLPYQHTALKDVMKWVGKGELMDSLFVFQHAEVEAENGLWKEVEGSPTADYPIAFEATLMPSGELGLTLVGQSQYLNEEVANKLIKSVGDALMGLKSAGQEIDILISSGARVTSAKTDAAKKEMEANDTFEWTATTEAIRAEIAALTKVDVAQIQPFTTLFSLGLDSIDLIKLASRLKSKGMKISVSALVKAGCIAYMMKSITSPDAAPAKVSIKLEDVEKQLRAALEKEAKISADDDKIEAVLPATPLQEGMVAEMVASNYERYFNHELYKLAPSTDLLRIISAWEACIASHPILRTTFMEVEDPNTYIGYAQIVRKYEPGIWQSANIETGNPRSASVVEVMQKEIANCIVDGKRGKLLQLRAFTQGEDRYYLLSISHALYDGWSLDALHGDVMKAYNGQDITRPSPRNTLEQVINANGPEAAKYWKTALTGLPRSSFPVKDTTSDKVNRAERISSLKLADLQSFCRASNISLQTLGQTAWALLLAAYLQNLDVAFGVVLSCRDEEEARRVVMPLMNTVAVRTVLNGTAANMLETSQDNSSRMREFQHFPLRKARALAAQQSGDGGALFDTLFIFQRGNDAEKVGGDGEKKLYSPVESKSEVEFAICVEMEIQGEELLWRTACKDAARDEREIVELLESLDKVLKTLVEKKEEDVIKMSVEGISICGLPAFKMPETGMTSSMKNPISKRVNAPWTENENIIRNVLAQVSKTQEENITRETSIFHLGLDSISAIKLASLLRRQSLHIGVNEIIKNPTVRGITSIIESRNMKSAMSTKSTSLEAEKTIQNSLSHLNRAEIVQAAGIDEDSVEYILPLTAGQLYMAERFRRSYGSVFSATFQWRFSGFIQRANIQYVWGSVLHRHPVLRSKIVLGLDKVGGVQVITTNWSHWNQVSFHDPNCPEGYCTDDLPTPVDFLNPVKLSVEQDVHGDGESIVRLQILHVLYDAMSLDRVLEELQFAFGKKEEVWELEPPREGEWREFVASGLAESIKQEQEKFWKSYLPIVKQQPTPVEHDKTKTGKIEVFQPAVEIGDIRSKARDAGVSVDAYVLAAVSRVWAAHSGLGLGVYMSNRSSDATANLAGPTLNLLPLRIPVTEGAMNGKLQEAAKQVQVDLGKLGDDVVIKTRLDDIFAWTGQTVGCWVNLLKNGEGSTDDASSVGNGAKDKLFDHSLNTNQMLRPRAEVKETNENGEEEEVKPYGKAVDIELRVVNEGRGLDVGLFADESILSLDDAEQIVETLQLVLGGL